MDDTKADGTARGREGEPERLMLWSSRGRAVFLAARALCGVLGCGALAAFAQGLGLTGRVGCGFIAVLFALSLGLDVRKMMRPRLELVIDDDGICQPGLFGRTRRIDWDEIENLSFDLRGNVVYVVPNGASVLERESLLARLGINWGHPALRNAILVSLVALSREDRRRAILYLTRYSAPSPDPVEGDAHSGAALTDRLGFGLWLLGAVCFLLSGFMAAWVLVVALGSWALAAVIGIVSHRQDQHGLAPPGAPRRLSAGILLMVLALLVPLVMGQVSGLSGTGWSFAIMVTLGLAGLITMKSNLIRSLWQVVHHEDRQ